MTLSIEVYEADNATLVDEIRPGQFISCKGAHIPLGGSGTVVLPRIVGRAASVTLTATGGTFTVTYAGQTTAAVAFDADAATLQAALVALSNISTGDVDVAGEPGGPFSIAFAGNFGIVSLLSVDGASLTGGGISLELPDAVANPALALIQHQRLIRFTDDHDDVEADPFVWTMEIEGIDDIVVSPENEAGETTTVTGRDWLSARLDKINVLPDRGLENEPWDKVRQFDYSADRLRDDDAAAPQGIWPNAVHTPPDFDNTTPMHGRPEGYVNTSAEFLWSEDVSGGSVDAGDNWFRQRDTFPGGPVYFELAADDLAELKVDNVTELRVEKVYVGGSVHCIVENVSAGEHLIAVKGTNANALKAFVTASWWTVSDGMPDTLIGSLNETDCRALAYPAFPPGFTPPEVTRLVIDEQQDRGRLAGLGFSYTSAADTDGNTVDEVTDITCNVAPADTILTLFKTLAGSYLDIDCDYAGGGVDVEDNPCDLLIHAWRRTWNGAQLQETVIFEKGTAREVSHEARSNERASVVHASGNRFPSFEVDWSAGDGSDYYEISLDFGDASRATAERLVEEYLNDLWWYSAGGWRSGIAVELVPGAGPKPGKDFSVYDYVGVLDPGGTIGSHRVHGVAFSLGADSVVAYSVILDQPAQLLEERQATTLRKQNPGTVGGRSMLTSPSQSQSVSQQPGAENAAHKWQWDGPLGEIQLYKDGAAITGAVIDASDLTDPGDTKGTTLTGNSSGAGTRRYDKNTDKIQISAGGGDLSPSWVPTTGRWLQHMRATVSDDGETIIISVSVAE